jgi:hypothetical protein
MAKSWCFKGPRKLGVTCWWAPALDDHLLIRFKRFEKGAVAQKLSTLGRELGQGQCSPVPVSTLQLVVIGNCPRG